MKKKLLIIIAVVTVAAAVFFALRSLTGADSDYFEENVEVLSDDEGGDFSTCYNSYSFSLFNHVLRCGDCSYVLGKGVNIGGICHF